MSLNGFQQALTLLIRRPVSRYPEMLNSALQTYELTSDEKSQLGRLCTEREFIKYGEELAEQRWNKLSRNITRVIDIIGEDVIRQIWLESYEPAAVRTKSDLEGHADYTIGFLDFLVNDSGAVALVAETDPPPYLQDVIRYERAEEELAQEDQAWPSPPEGSDLAVTNFRILNLSFDIPTLFDEDLEETPELSEIERPVILVMLGQGRQMDPQVFEIDDSIARYLRGHLASLPTGNISEDLYEEMVGVGLLRDRQ